MSASQFDQRYDSIYQRGGEAHETGQGGGRPATGQATRSAAVEVSADVAAESTAIAEVVPPDAAPRVHADGITDERRKINPYLVALWVFGIGLSVFGAWGSVAPSFLEMQAQPNNPFGPPWYFVLYTLAPNVLVAGLVTIAGVLTLHAVGWMRRHG